MTMRDCRGLELTAADDNAVAGFDAAVRSYLNMERRTGDRLKTVLAADPDMPLALCLRGYFLQLFCDARLDAKADSSLAAAEVAAEKRGATARERAHIAALARWRRNDLEGAAEIWESILVEWPRDVLALRLAHHAHFYAGAGGEMRDSVARALPAWNEALPEYGNVVGMYAFGLEEAGDYRRAEAKGREAVERNPSDIWSAHAMAHVFEMQDRSAEGIAWIDSLAANWTGCHNFAGHVWWHKALFHLARGEHDAVLALYDGKIRADLSEEYLDLTNGAALLWRLEDAGVDVGGRWSELAERSEKRVRDGILPFADAHYAMALAACGRDEAVATLLAGARGAPGGASTVAAAVGAPLIEAIAALRAGEYGRALDLLLPLRRRLFALGGSHAQRDIFAQMTVRAALGAGRFALARALLAARRAERPAEPWGRRAYEAAEAGLARDTARA